MDSITEKIEAVDWEIIADSINQTGYAMLSRMLSDDTCDDLVKSYNQARRFRKTVVMERFRFGKGEYKYFDYPLPEIVESLRNLLYIKLSPIANSWMDVLKLNIKYPENYIDFQHLCHENHQFLATPLILKYNEGGFNTLHQDLYGDVYFPFQAVICLNEPHLDYEGGEFVLVRQAPRAQSKAIVLQPKKGDMIIFTTNFKPEKGKQRYYRVHMKHGVSTVHMGIRHTLGIIFHDAKS